MLSIIDKHPPKNYYSMVFLLKLYIAIVYRILFPILFFISFVNLEICYSQNIKYNIKIDASKKDTLKLSQIGYVKKIIPLEETQSNHVLESNQVVIDGKDIFLTFGFNPREIYNYDFNGNLKKKISVNENLIKGSLYFDCDTLNNMLFLRSMSKTDTVYCLNYDGKILNKFKVPHRPPFYFHNGMLWGTDKRTEDIYDNYSLYSTNKNGESTLVWEMQNDITAFPDMKYGRLPPSFSSNNKALFFSMFLDQTIYKIENFKMSPYVKFEFINGQPNYYDYVAAKPQIINGRWIMIGYRLQHKWFTHFYNTKTNRSYNLAHKKIFDDVFNTDGLNLNIFNNMSNGLVAFLVATNLTQITTNKKERMKSLVLMTVD